MTTRQFVKKVQAQLVDVMRGLDKDRPVRDMWTRGPRRVPRPWLQCQTRAQWTSVRFCFTTLHLLS